MAGETTITVVGNLTNDPELRFTPSGSAVANFTVASTPRVFDRQSNEWREGETLFLRCSIWRDQAENAAESLQKGMRVVVNGKLRSRSYDTREGDRRTVIELEVEEIGPSLRFATASVNRSQRNTNQNNTNFGNQQNSSNSNQNNSSKNKNDPWNNTVTNESSAWGDSVDSDDPPF